MNITVYCGSSFGNNEEYKKSAYEFGKALTQNNHKQIYGGGSVGLTGELADSVLKNGGEVVGVIPTHLEDKELAHYGLNELHVVKTMSERKMIMAELGEAFVALSGGGGTFEELFEVWTLAQLGYHQKPIAFLNTNGFYDKLFEFLNSVCKEGFIKQPYLDMLIIESEPNRLLERIYAYTPPPPKWSKEKI